MRILINHILRITSQFTDILIYNYLMEGRFQQAYQQFSKLVLGDQVREGTSTSMKNCLANIYTMDEHSTTFRYSKLSGILTLDLDRKLKSNFFRMYSLDTFELLFECELYYGFGENYRPLSENLWAFDFLEGIIMFQFINHGEAQHMADAVKAQPMHQMSKYNEVIAKRKLEEDKKKSDNSFFGKMKNYLKGQQKKQSGKVQSVKKVNSITFDQVTGKFVNIPPYMMEQFIKAGISPKDLENKQTARAVMEEIVVFQTIKEASSDPNATALRQTIKTMNLDVNQYARQQKLPPPPPPPSGLLPPPPPPTMPSQSSKPAVVGRGNLLKQIQAGNFKLKPVSHEDNKTTVDLDEMDKDDRVDLSDRLRNMLKQRNKALMRDQDND